MCENGVLSVHSSLPLYLHGVRVPRTAENSGLEEQEVRKSNYNKETLSGKIQAVMGRNEFPPSYHVFFPLWDS